MNKHLFECPSLRHFIISAGMCQFINFVHLEKIVLFVTFYTQNLLAGYFIELLFIEILHVGNLFMPLRNALSCFVKELCGVLIFGNNKGLLHRLHTTI